jgi:signal transduction histidine kinase
MRRPPSRLLELGLGARLLLIILLAAVVPLALAGVWLTRDAGRAGEEFLVQRMDETLAGLSREVGAEWIRARSALLDLAESEPVLTLLREEGEPGGGTTPEPVPFPPAHADRLQEVAHEAIVRDRNGDVAVRFAAEGTGPGRGVPVRLPIHAPLSGERLGTFEVRLVLDLLVARAPEWTARTGGVLGILEPGGDRSVLPTPFDPHLLATPRFLLGGEEWITARRGLSDPAVVLVLASPLEPFAEPFREAARRGVLLLLAVAFTGFAIAALLTRQVTRPVLELAEASRAFAEGDLDRRVAVRGPGEIRQLGRAFNTMASKVQRTTDALAKQEALAAVGEFAAGLAHELRNPLTAIRLDLQRVEEVSQDEERRRNLTNRMLEAMRKLDRTVSEVLRVAGSGRLRFEAIPLREPLEAAMEAVRPSADRAGVEVEGLSLPGDGPRVVADAGALEQVFLNLLRNAMEALEEVEEKPRRVQVEVTSADEVQVRIRDTGPGIPPEDLERVFEPLFTTKRGGTGLGLVIARRIVRAHGGEIRVESRTDEGTAVTVHLPARDPTPAQHPGRGGPTPPDSP